ncbi:DNA internalization-related competence protein ComEC/Rec2 [Marininema halotolerans]|uniref:Competence protein ComEC n=1 Tax=Marininema halotolerans TaxID=1155944 RepID=A0A1I6RYS0_9BACL|nr:DNA internalization-related competence protein ComEC/Rec2 [Marininema halotolerans]SFS69842.1 competence protein ComEC [Marininema halotolerans]
MKRPIVVLASGWILGVIVSSGWSLPFQWMIALTPWVWLVGGWMVYFQRRYPVIILLVCACTTGMVHFAWVDQHNRTLLTDEVEEGRIMGRIVSSPKIDGGWIQAEIEVYQLHTSKGWVQMKGEKMLLRVSLQSRKEKESAQRLERGAGVLASSVSLSRPSLARNPGAFNMRQYLYREGIHWVGDVKGWGNLHQIDSPRGIDRSVDRLRLIVMQKIEEIYPPETAGVMSGMLLGIREAVPSTIEEEFIHLGLVHLLAVSGLHVAIVVAMMYGGLTFMRVTREKAVMVTLCAIPIYVFLTGAAPSTVRAGVMAILGLMTLWWRRAPDRLSFLALAALLLLWWDPYILFSVGFQLSFGVTFALLVATGPVVEVLPFRWVAFNQVVAVTTIAQLASFPIILYHFHVISWLSWGVNLIIVPIFSLMITPLGYGALFLSFFNETLASLPAWLSSQVLSGVLYGMKWLTSLNGFEQSWEPPSWWWIFLYAGSVAYLLWSYTGGPLRPWRHRLTALVLLFGSIVFLHLPWVIQPGKELTITFLDVGQGDCTVIETPTGKVILVDGGGQLPFAKKEWQRKRKEYDVGKSVIIPYLHYQGIDKIDWLVITHGDADHIGGLGAVVKRFPVGKVIRNHHPPGSEMERALIKLLNQKQVPLLLPPLDRPYIIDQGITWQFLHPNTTGQTPGKLESSNDDSVVFLLEAGGSRILFTGDIEAHGEEEIRKRWELPSIDVLKVAHHGSKTSTEQELLNKLHPREAVISVGKNNRYGHPSPVVIKRLQQDGSRIWRTDHQGAITLRISPGKREMKAMLESVPSLQPFKD